MPRFLSPVAAILVIAGLLAGCSSDSAPSDSPAAASSPGAAASSPEAMGSATAATSDSAVTTMSPYEFSIAISFDEVVVVDVRTPAEYDAGHLVGAMNIDVQSDDFATQIEALPKEKTYAVYCRSGNRSAAAAQQMAAAGFTNVINLDGGLVDLEAANVATETS